MATWSFSGYNNGRGAAVTFTYTASFNAAANQTTVTITNLTSVFNTGGASSICSLTGTLTLKAADNTGSSGTLDVSQSKNGNSPTISTDVSHTITVSHGTGTSKQIILAFSGDINANYYHTYPDESTTVTVASATARSLSIFAGEGASVTVNRAYSPWADTGALTGGTVYDGDVLTISFSVSTGYNLSTHTVNGSSFTSGGAHTVSGDVTIVATAVRISYTLTLTTDGHCALTVERSGEVLSDGSTIYYGDSLNISFSAQPGYEVKSAILNGSEITSPYIHRVTGSVDLTIVTVLLSSAWIYTNGAFKRYFINIFTQGKWRKCREKIFPGGGTEQPSYGNLILSTASLSIKEGQSATFTVTLDSAPSVNQTVQMSASDNAKLTVAPAILTFTPGDWNVAQTVTVEVPSGTTGGATSVTITSAGVYSVELPVVIEASSPFMEVSWLDTAYVVGENANANYNAWCPDTVAYDSTRDKIVFMQYHATKHNGTALDKTVVTINPYDPTVYEKVEAFPGLTSGDGVGGLLVKDGVWTVYGMKKRHRTSDGGTTWESVDVVTPPARMYGVFDIDGVLYCGDDYSTTDAAHNGWYYVSYDDGLNWEQKVFDFANDYAIPCSEARFCKWQGKLYAAIRRENDTGLLARLDGEIWVVVTDQLPNVSSDTSCTAFDDIIAMSSIDRPNRKLIMSVWNGSELTVVKEYNFNGVTVSGDFHTPTYVKGKDWQAVFFMTYAGMGAEYETAMNAAVFGYKEGVAANTPTYEIAKSTYTWEDVLAEPYHNCTVAISDSGVEIDVTNTDKQPYIAINKRWGAGTYAPNEDGTIRAYSFINRIRAAQYIPDRTYASILMDTKTVGNRTYLCVVKSDREAQSDGTVLTKIMGIANELVVEGSDMSGAPYVAGVFNFLKAGTSYKTTGTTYSAV